MKTIPQLLCVIVLAALTAPAPRLLAQTPHPAISAARQAHLSVAKDEHMDAPETPSELETYRHSTVVEAIARYGHVSTETAAEIFEDINSGVLLLALFIVIWKYLPGVLRRRSDTLQHELVGAHTATEEANRRLAAVEARLLRLDEEIEAIRQQVEQEAAEDEKRIHATLEAERERIVASAEQEIAAAQSAAQRELKKFAADLAIDHAMRRIQLSTDTDRALVRDFGKTLGSGGKA